MKHFFIFLPAFLIIIALAVFNLCLIFGEMYFLPSGGSLSQWRPNHTLVSICLPGNSVCAGQTATTTAPTADNVAAEISISSPAANQVVSSPLEISGKALGNWYFEASFPIKLIGEDGQVLAEGQAAAQSDWTTSDFVPFKSELKFDAGSSTIGMLVFSNDNPSGLPQNEKQFGIPVRFSDVAQIPVKIYFGNAELSNGSNDCSLVYPVERLIAKTPTVARASLEQLLSGITDQEKNQGYFTAVEAGVKINSLTINSGIAKIDFDSTMAGKLGNNCQGVETRAQITQTLEQFPTVQNVIISVNGSIEAAPQPQPQVLN